VRAVARNLDTTSLVSSQSMIGGEIYFQKVGCLKQRHDKETAKKNPKAGTERSQRFERLKLQWAFILTAGRETISRRGETLSRGTFQPITRTKNVTAELPHYRR
jgi:hypothetical protein